VRLKRDIAEGECLAWNDVALDENDLAVKVRRELEATFRPATPDRAGERMKPGALHSSVNRRGRRCPAGR
jgi:hypothetical protein